MATFAEARKEALAKGYTDDEIRSHLMSSPQWKEAKAGGFSDSDILQHLGMLDVGEQIGRKLNVAGSAIAEGLASVPGIPGDIENLANKVGSRYLPSWAASGDSEGTVFPTSSETVQMAHALGLPQGPVPQGTLESYMSGIGKGTAAAAVLPGGTLARRLAAGASGAAAGEAAHQLMPDSEWAPIIAGGIGGLGAEGGLGMLAEHAFGKAVSGATGEASTAGTLAQKAKDAVTALQQQKTEALFGRRDVQIGEKEALKSAVDAHSTLIPELQKQADAQVAATTQPAQEMIDNHVDPLGSSTTPQQAGNNLQDAARKWLTTDFPAKKAAAWAPVDAQIPASTPVALGAFGQALASIRGNAGVLQPLADSMGGAMVRRVSDALSNVEAGQQLGVVAPTTWADVRQLRTTLGDAMANPQTTRDIGAQNLAHLYATATQDLRTTAQAISPEAVAAFDAANAETTRLFDIAQGPMAKVVDSPTKSLMDPKPENVVTSLLAGGKKGATDLAVLRQELPDATNDLTHYAVKDGKWTGLAPEAKEALVPDPGIRGDLDVAHSTIASATDAAEAAKDVQVGASLDSIQALKESHAQAALDHSKEMLDQDREINKAKLTADAMDSNASDAANALAALKAQRGQSPPILGGLGGRLGSMVGGSYLGEQFGAAATNLLGLPAAAPGVMGAVGTVLPLAAQGLGAVIRDPSLAYEPLVGMAAGNALAIPTR